jgi:hypothetical protein
MPNGRTVLSTSFQISAYKNFALEKLAEKSRFRGSFEILFFSLRRLVDNYCTEPEKRPVDGSEGITTKKRSSLNILKQKKR